MNVYENENIIRANMQRASIHRKDGTYIRYEGKLYKLQTVLNGQLQPSAFIDITQHNFTKTA